jgi:mannose-6-phosphate isomerase-like protein (cupin superfamily)
MDGNRSSKAPASQAECKIFRADDSSLNEIVPGKAFFKHMQGTDVSLGYYKMVKGPDGHAPSFPNLHGEEVCFVLKGRIKLFADGKEYALGEGDVIVVPPYLEHTGEFVDDECILLSVFTPRREEWGADDNARPSLPFVQGKA